MIEEQELQDAAPPLGDALGHRVHHHAFRHAGAASDLQLGHLLDFDQTDAAQPHRVHLGMVAIHRHGRAQQLGGLDNERAFRNRQRVAVDHHVDHPPSDVGFVGAQAALASRLRNGQPAWATCAANSSGNRFSTDAKKGMMESPSGHRFVPVIVLLMTLSTRRSFSEPSPASKRETMRATHWPPSRQGVHCPHDSCSKKRTSVWAARTMHALSSMTTKPPDPSIVFFAASESKSMPVSRSSGKIAADEPPPGWIALSRRPGSSPPAYCSRSSRAEMPIGTS